MHRQLLKPYVQKTSSRGHCIYIYIYIRLSVLGLLINRVRKDIEVNRYLYIMLIHIIINLLEFDWSKREFQWWSFGLCHLFRDKVESNNEQSWRRKFTECQCLLCRLYIGPLPITESMDFLYKKGDILVLQLVLRRQLMFQFSKYIIIYCNNTNNFKQIQEKLSGSLSNSFMKN